MNYINQFIFFILLFLCNSLLRVMFNKINYKINIKFIIWDSFFISSIFPILYIIIDYIWYFRVDKNINYWLELSLMFFVWLLIPSIYIYWKYKYLKYKWINISEYYSLFEIFILIFSLSIASIVL